MNEQQCDDLYIPAILLKTSPKAAAKGYVTDDVEDFLKNIEGWTEYIPPDEYEE